MQKINILPQIKKLQKTGDYYSIEFFHVYSDEQIKEEHLKSIEYLKTLQKIWDIKLSRIVLLDDYNPKEHILSIEEVIDFTSAEGVGPHYWALESSLVQNANLFLDQITDKKLKKNYITYIAAHQKIPCSLLTATWYLTRLGALDAKGVIHSVSRKRFKAADRLINILPVEYKPVELRALKLIEKSPHKDYGHKIQDLFYDAQPHEELDLF